MTQVPYCSASNKAAGLVQVAIISLGLNITKIGRLMVQVFPIFIFTKVKKTNVVLHYYF